jgi:hypothetical protein
MNVLGDGNGLSRDELKTRRIGHTIAAADFLVIERLFQVHGEGLRAAVAATVPCFRHRRRLRLGFRGHLSVGGRRSDFLEWYSLLRMSKYVRPKTIGRHISLRRPQLI